MTTVHSNERPSESRQHGPSRPVAALTIARVGEDRLAQVGLGRIGQVESFARVQVLKGSTPATDIRGGREARESRGPRTALCEPGTTAKGPFSIVLMSDRMIVALVESVRQLLRKAGQKAGAGELHERALTAVELLGGMVVTVAERAHAREAAVVQAAAVARAVLLLK